MKRYVAPIVASALMLASSLMCTGCDETDGDGTSTGGSFVVVTDENGSEYTVFVEEVTEPEPKIVSLPEKATSEIEATVGSFNFEDAINQKYSKKASALIEEALKDQVMKPDGTGSAEKKAIAVAMDNLLGGDDKFLIDLNILLDGYPTDCSLQYYRDEDASVFIINTPSGTLYNGVVNGDVYTDGSEYLGPFGLTEETGALLRQMSFRTDIDKLHGDEIMSFVFFPDGYSSGVQRSADADELSYCEIGYKKTIYKEAETSPFGDIITEGHYTQSCTNSSLLLHYSGSYSNGARIENTDFLVGTLNDIVTYATATFDYEPDAVVLPD